MSMTLATTWVRRGVAAQFPTKYQVDEAELDRISKLARLQLEDAQEDLENAQNPKRDDEESEDTESDNGVSTAEAVKANGAAAEGTDDLREYNLDDYDDDDDAPQQSEKFAMFGNVGSLAYHAPHEEDPYLVLPEGEQDSEDEREELQILPSDNLILAAKVEDEVAHLEVFVYEDEADNLYIHHDIMLPAIPLCVEWINVPVGKEAEKRTEGNFVAVGTMSPEIEVWDLDVVDSMYPNAILGQEPDATAEGETNDESSTKKKSSKKKKKKPKANDDYHVDAVLALAANRQHRNLLASASADKTVKLWDLTTGKCAKSYTMHRDKVCALDWHPTESTVLLSGSYDRTVIATDMRAPDAVAPKWVVEADVEKVRWDIHDPNFFFVTTEIGTVHYFDARVVPTSHDKPSKPVWTLHAHDGAVSAFDISPSVPGLLATGSEDKRVKLWNIENNIPSMVVARNLDVGRIFSVQFAPDPDVAFRLSVAGSRGQLQVWDISTNPSVRKVFAHKVKLPETDGKERFVALPDDGTDDDEEEDGGMEAGGQEGWESMDED
ncbi:rRNA-processing protein [Exophiala xenobiotica]|nr:rRNA-processing protein [Exophiala xenobiotica]KAK5281603.1 rRNA-processing protein [Exophiala xenobiotica]KAK5354960.1 rRNA-processing protein [Exophiala xenobiotica]KAK5382950.1 rRNA-processing protein [Exophiala xenobiotica]KAK5386267.1 rRNA-processing protein [Exophiala xenobiotica]